MTTTDTAFPFRCDLLAGRTALVTGGNAGLGAAITCALVRSGAKVAVVARNKEEYDVLVDEHDYLAGGETVEFFQADVSDPNEVASSAKAAAEWAGAAFDILVNNAGVSPGGIPVSDITADQWEQTMAVNARGPLLMAQACAPGMIANKYGKIVNISSQASVRADGSAAYSASKASVDALTRSMAAEWARHGVQVNSVAPTLVMAGMGQRAWESGRGREWLERAPTRRFPTAEEIANTVVFLCSDAAPSICGQTVLIDGGQTIFV